MDLQVNLNKLTLKNPVTTASGTYGYGTEYIDLYPPGELGAVFLKGITVEERDGNASPRIVETPSGMLNAIGLQNVGLQRFIKEKIPALKNIDGTFIANISGKTVEEFSYLAEVLNEESTISGIEVNVSCPNVKEGGIQFGVNSEMIQKITKAVKNVYKRCLIVKLSPNVTNIVEMAKASEDSGADAICVANTLLGMVIDIKTKKPVLGNKMGGLSGPAIRPIIVRMVYQITRSIKIPVIGCGGICSVQDAIEFFLAGAKVISIGTGIFHDPYIPIKVLSGIKKYMEENNFSSIEEINNALLD